jgi:putative salt-induced outer membrane protein YdiY
MGHVALADTVKLKNGDVLTGTIIKKETDQLVLKTSYAGEISIAWSEISTLDSTERVKVVLADKSSFTGVIKQTEPGRAKVVLSSLNTSADIDLKDLTYINPSAEVSGEGVAWSGYANVGGAMTQGNSETTVLNANAEAIARTKENRYTVGAVINRADNKGTDTVSNSRGYMKYDHFLSKKWYVYANTTLENDKFRDINLRTSAGVGSGYQIYEQPDLNLSVEGGVNYINVDYDQAADEGYASGRWALKYDQLLLGNNVKFFHQHELLFGLEDLGNTLLFTKTGLRVPIAKNLNASTQLNVDYNNRPVANRKSLDKTLLFSVGYGW